MKFKHFFYLILSFFTLLWSSLAHSDYESDFTDTILIDGFENKQDWIIKFSKFRSKNWSGDLKKPYEESNDWSIQIDSSKYKDDEILAPGLFKKIPFFKNIGTSLIAIRGQWDFKDNNWILIEPSSVRASIGDVSRALEIHAYKDTLIPKTRLWKKGTSPNFIWMPGNVREVSFFLWGSNTSHKLELHFLDYKENMHIIQAGDFKFRGWKHVRVPISYKINQVNNYSNTKVRPLRFVRFKIICDYKESSKYFYTYFDHFYATTEMNNNLFPGYSLRFVDSYWGEGK